MLGQVGYLVPVIYPYSLLPYSIFTYFIIKPKIRYLHYQQPITRMMYLIYIQLHTPTVTCAERLTYRVRVSLCVCKGQVRCVLSLFACLFLKRYDGGLPVTDSQKCNAFSVTTSRQLSQVLTLSFTNGSLSSERKARSPCVVVASVSTPVLLYFKYNQEESGTVQCTYQLIRYRNKINKTKIF